MAVLGGSPGTGGGEARRPPHAPVHEVVGEGPDGVGAERGAPDILMSCLAWGSGEVAQELGQQGSPLLDEPGEEHGGLGRQARQGHGPDPSTKAPLTPAEVPSCGRNMS
jgi:hypothetical protein